LGFISAALNFCHSCHELPSLLQICMIFLIKNPIIKLGASLRHGERAPIYGL
jgi:hypothetical protein